MIITCPSCATRYEIPADLIGPSGRMVRCTSCGHRWFVAHDGSNGTPVDEVAVSDAGSGDPGDGAEPYAQSGDHELSASDEIADGLPPLDRAPGIGPRAGAGRPAGAGRSTAATIGWLAVLLILLALSGLVLGRNELVALAPQVAPIYQRLGLPVTQAIGLELTGIVSERLAGDDGEMIRITGTVRNVAGIEREVPPLRIALLDADRQEVLVELVEVPQAELADGAITRFTVDLPEPPDRALNFSVTFAVEE